ncbi:MAG: ABC transporter substrate-binding protein [Butyrivibrio sp.]|nr:ABC transporter substrate-binding protein [Acetatifactor muris]MCM1558845.1 ABC transporter substrate-binding protein [Butyrivibrio sp.]
MKKRLVAVILSAALGMTMLAGCGNEGTPSRGGDSVENDLSDTTGDDTGATVSGEGGSGVDSSEEGGVANSSGSAGDSGAETENYDGKLVSAGTMQMDFAKGFSIELFEGGYRMITVGAPGEKYLVVPEGMSVPGDTDETVTVLQLPIDKAYIASTSMVSLMNAIGALDYVRLVATDVDGWYIEEVSKAMEDGSIGFSGNYKEPDYEMMVDQGIRLHLDNAMVDSVPEVNEKFTELGIPNLVEISSKESHPLARVEWVKMLGVLFGREAEAQAYFDSQKALMEQATAAESTGITVAMGYITSSGKCYARNGGDYLVQMIQLAGGDYICADMEPEESGNTSMTFEEWYAAFKDADYLFYWNLGNKFYSIQEMTEYEPLFADFKAVREGHVWITSPDFTQATSAISSIVSDMHTILSSENPNTVTTDHLIKLPQEAEGQD